MKSQSDIPFIFYLTLEEKLPPTFYHLDKSLKKLGFMLVPIQIDQLQTLISVSDQEHITVVTSTMVGREFKYYNDKVRTILKYLLKSPRMTFIHLSSFAKLNDTKKFFTLKNYIFLKYPVNPQVLAVRIARHHDAQKESMDRRWPGGRRAGVRGVAV